MENCPKQTSFWSVVAWRESPRCSGALCSRVHSTHWRRVWCKPMRWLIVGCSKLAGAPVDLNWGVQANRKEVWGVQANRRVFYRKADRRLTGIASLRHIEDIEKIKARTSLSWFQCYWRMEYDVLRSIAKCLADSSGTEKEVELTELRISCIKAIASNFNGKNQKINFCDVSRLQFPTSQKSRAGNLQPVR